jgi:hypothetical protein
MVAQIFETNAFAKLRDLGADRRRGSRRILASASKKSQRRAAGRDDGPFKQADW